MKNMMYHYLQLTTAIRSERGLTNKIKYYFTVLIKNDFLKHKQNNKSDFLINEMLFIRKLKQSLNVQTDSIRAKVFT